ncbi:MAG: UbiA family prenyltransferase [Chloroflexi bacterium]|nr:UbiA family prenyltransferase [Chloroflexota bacterium]
MGYERGGGGIGHGRSPPLTPPTDCHSIQTARSVALVAFRLWGSRLGRIIRWASHTGRHVVAGTHRNPLRWWGSAINQYLEREKDTYMKRTAKRPLATGQIANPVLVLWLGLGMILGPAD